MMFKQFIFCLFFRGEGNVLEPTDITGYMYIKAVQRARHITNNIACDWAALKAFNAHHFDPITPIIPN
jgi:hypothetical protein